MKDIILVEAGSSERFEMLVASHQKERYEALLETFKVAPLSGGNVMYVILMRQVYPVNLHRKKG